MILNDVNTWPDDVKEYLNEHVHIFRKWEQQPSGGPIAPYHEIMAQVAEYESFIEGLRTVLSNQVLRGYHCTRLTEQEVNEIIANGMQLPNQTMLRNRIQMLQNAGSINAAIAERLQKENQADDDNRAGMIWFCFSTDILKCKSGVIRLFRSWGGEALYNSHERDKVTGSILRQLGSPCIVEADISISNFPRHTFLDNKVARQFLVNRGFETCEPVDHEDRTLHPVPARSIRRIIRFGDPDFERLTLCNSWSPQLT